jgi:hypothetical protein
MRFAFAIVLLVASVASAAPPVDVPKEVAGAAVACWPRASASP